MHHDIEHLSESLQSYLAAALGYFAQYDLMNIGAAILLVARLVVDIPSAYRAIREYLRKK
jgi:hypothetical protein